MSCGCDGKRCSIFLDCPNPGSLVEKKKFSSTTGLRSTRAATSPNSTTVNASIHQCVPNRTGLFTMEQSISRFDAGGQQVAKADIARLIHSVGDPDYRVVNNI